MLSNFRRRISELRQTSEMKITEVINNQSDKDPIAQESIKSTRTTVSVPGKTFLIGLKSK